MDQKQIEMTKDKPVVSYIKYEIQHSDGTTSSGADILPKEIMTNILVDMFQWDENWIHTYKEAKEYYEEEKKMLDKIKNK